MRKILVLLAVVTLLLPSVAGAYELYKSGDVSLNMGYWAQTWYQYVSDYDTTGDGVEDESLNDFMMRRSYFSVSGTATSELSFFMHYANDRIGQDGLDNSGLGLGSGLAVRDAWVNYKILGNDLMVQMGRMYVPFTRDYGTTSTKALMTTDLNWGQGGIRSGIFYPSKVGRDDSATIWGNVLDDKLQYRFMLGEGVEDSDLEDPGPGALNPDDQLRYAGRMSYNLLDTETSWFNKGTNLGEASIIAIGAGFDYQADLSWADSDGVIVQQDDYKAYTFDVHVDMPMGIGAVTGDAAYINVDNSANGVTYTDLEAGGDGEMISGSLGYLFYDRIQPFGHVEAILPDEEGTEDTMVYGLGCNYYFKGLANKLTLEWTKVDSDSDTVEDKDIITLQAAFGF